MGIETAILGSAALGLGGSLIAGKMGSDAAQNAANAQSVAALAGIGVQRDAAVQSRVDSYPWALAGAQALYAYMDELGVPMPQTPILPDLTAGPFGYGGKSSSGSSGGTGSVSMPSLGALGLGGATAAAKPSDAFQVGGKWYVKDETSQKKIGGIGNVREVAGPGATNATAALSALGLSGANAGSGTGAGGSKNPMAVANIPMTERKGFQETPGYQFMVSEGEKGVVNNLSALGMKNSGAALKALTRFREGVANQEYNTYLNRLASAAGMGQTQTANTNAAMQAAAGGIAQGYSDYGAARGSGYVGSANAWGNALGSATNQAGNALGWMAYANNGGGLY